MRWVSRARIVAAYLIHAQFVKNGVSGNFVTNLPKSRLCGHYGITSGLPVSDQNT